MGDKTFPEGVACGALSPTFKATDVLRDAAEDLQSALAVTLANIQSALADAWDEGHRFTGYAPSPGENPYRDRSAHPPTPEPREDVADTCQHCGRRRPNGCLCRIPISRRYTEDEVAERVRAAAERAWDECDASWGVRGLTPDNANPYRADRRAER